MPFLLSQCTLDRVRTGCCSSSEDCSVAEFLARILDPLTVLIVVSTHSFGDKKTEVVFT